MGPAPTTVQIVLDAGPVRRRTLWACSPGGVELVCGNITCSSVSARDVRTLHGPPTRLAYKPSCMLYACLTLSAVRYLISPTNSVKVPKERPSGIMLLGNVFVKKTTRTSEEGRVGVQRVQRLVCGPLPDAGNDTASSSQNCVASIVCPCLNDASV
jgi:hypothetical protein